MYLIDKEKVVALLDFMEDRLAQFDDILVLEGLPGDLACERYAEVLIAAILDVGHMMIDGFMMRDAGSYEDIICILADEQVITEGAKPVLIEFVTMRSKLMRDYVSLDHKIIRKTIASSKAELQAFPQRVRNYLQTEEKVAHAFGKKTE